MAPLDDAPSEPLRRDDADQGPHETIRAVITRGAQALDGIVAEPKRDATLLLSHAMEQSSTWLLAHDTDTVTAVEQQAFDGLLERRQQHEPMQYILGEQEFYGLQLFVNRHVLIPRPETEHLVEAVLDRMPRDRALRIADIGTGSGAIAVALASSLPQARIDAVDLSEGALAVAQHNAEFHRLTPRIRFLQSDLLTGLPEHAYDCIVSNPPYIRTEEVLEPQVLHWEPHTALFAGHDGLAIYRRLVPEARRALVPGGLLALEIGYGQQDAIEGIFDADQHWLQPDFIHDLQGIARVAAVRLRA